MELLEKKICPRCGAHSNAKHCIKSNKCNWRICIKCNGNPNQVLVFYKQNYFITGVS